VTLTALASRSPQNVTPTKNALKQPMFFHWGKQPNQKFPGGSHPGKTSHPGLRRRKNGLNAAEGALQAAKKMASWPAGCLPAGRDWGVEFFRPK